MLEIAEADRNTPNDTRFALTFYVIVQVQRSEDDAADTSIPSLEMSTA